MLANCHTTIFTAIHDGLIVGYVCLITGDRAANVYSIAVLEEYRGKGIGTKLLDRAEKHALSCGVRVIRLQVRCGSKAFKLYQRAGYCMTKIIKNYFGRDDAYRMEKQLQHWGCSIGKIDIAGKRDHTADVAIAP
ncbi:MAG: GNAT family N-acetyltransferase [Methanosarcinaceae archaeon]|nr:GNAT family N-acetyltransferase [Methanosarcinaceae archaeon]